MPGFGGGEANFELILETQKAYDEITNVWTEMRRQAANAVTVELNLDPNFGDATRQAELLSKKIGQIAEQIKNADKESEDLARDLQAGVRQLNILTGTGGSELQKDVGRRGSRAVDSAVKRLQKQYTPLGTPDEYIHGADREVNKILENVEVAGQKIRGIDSGVMSRLTQLIGEAQVYSQQAHAANRRLENANSLGKTAETHPKTFKKENDIIKNAEAQIEARIEEARRVGRESSNVQSRIGASALIDVYEQIAKLENLYNENIRAQEALLKQGKKPQAKEAGLKAQRIKNLGVNMQELIANPDLIGENAAHAAKFMSRVIKEGFAAAATALAQGIGNAVIKIKNFQSKEELHALRQATEKAFGDVNRQILLTTIQAAERAFGPLANQVNTEMRPVLAKLFGLPGSVAHPAVTGQVPGMQGAVGSGDVANFAAFNLAASPNGLVKSVNAIIRERNASERGWPLLHLKASKRELMSSVIEGIREFNSQDRQALKLNSKLDFTGKGIKAQLDKEYLVGQIESAFKAAGGTLRVGKVATGGGNGTSRGGNGNGKGGSSLDEILDVYGNEVIPNPKNAIERQHNARVRKANKIQSAAYTTNLSANPIGALREVSPGLARTAESIRKAIAEIPDLTKEGSLERKIDRMAHAEEQWQRLVNGLGSLADKMVKSGNTEGLRKLEALHPILEKQLGAQVVGYDPTKERLPKPVAVDEDPAVARERTIRERQAARIHRQGIQTNIASNPIQVLEKLAPDLGLMAQGIRKAIDLVPDPQQAGAAQSKIAAMQKAEQEWVALSTEMTKLADLLVHEAELGGKKGAQAAEALRTLFYLRPALAAQLGNPVSRFGPTRQAALVRQGLATAERPEVGEEARQAYLSNLPRFDRSVYGAVANAPFDAHKERLAAQEKLIALVRQYEKEMLGYTHARTQAEQQEAQKRVAALTREIELTKDIMNIRLLYGQQGQQTIRQFEPRLRANAEGEVFRTMVNTGKTISVNPLQAYQRTSAVLHEQFAPALETFNIALVDAKAALLKDARELTANRDYTGASQKYKAANRLRDLSFEELTGHIANPQANPMAPERRELYIKSLASTLRKTPEEEEHIAKISQLKISEEEKFARIQKYTEGIAEHRIQLFQQEARILGEQNALLDMQRTKMTVLSQYDEIKSRKQQDPYGLIRAQRGLSNTLGFYAGGMVLGYAVQSTVRQSLEYEKIIAEIRGILGSKSKSEAKLISDSVALVAQKYGSNLIETAQAAKTLAQAGFTASQTIRELDASLLAQRGLGITIEQMTELQTAIHAVDDTITSSALLEKLSRIEAAYPVTAQDIAASVKLLTPFLQQFEQGSRGAEDVVDITSGLTTVIVNKLRVTGTQAANALKAVLARILRPELLGKLQDRYDLKLGTEEGNVLPIDQIFKQLSLQYNALHNKGGASRVKAQQMLAEVAGGRQVAPLAALLTDYAKVQTIAAQSAGAFGQAQERAGFVMETMDQKIQNLKNSFQIFSNQMVNGTLVADGLKLALTGVSAVIGGASGQGGGLPAALAISAAGFGAVKGTQKLYTNFTNREIANQIGVPFAVLQSSLKEREIEQLRQRVGIAGAKGFSGGLGPAGLPIFAEEVATGAAVGTTAGAAAGGVGLLSKGLGGLVKLLGPTGVIIGGILGFTVALGLLSRLIDRVTKGTQDAAKYRVTIKSDEQLDIVNSPQYQRLDKDAKEQFDYPGAYSAYKNVKEAVFDPETQRRVAKAAGGLTDFGKIVEGINTGKITNAGKIANELLDAIATSPALSPDAKARIAQITSAEERRAVVSKLLGEVMENASYRMEQAIASLQNSINLQLDEAGKGIEAMGDKNKNWFGKFLDQIGFNESLKTKIHFGKTSTDPLLRGDALLFSGLRDIFSAAHVPTKIVNELTNAGSIFGKTIKSVADSLSEAGKSSAPFADMLVATFKKLHEQTTTYQKVGGFDLKTNAYQLQQVQGSAYTGAVEELARATLEQTGTVKGLPSLEGLTETSGKLKPEEQAQQEWTAFIEDARGRAAEIATAQARARNPNATALQLADIIAHQMDAVKISLETASTGLSEFKDRLTEMVLSLYQGAEKLRTEEKLAARFGDAYNVPGQRAQFLRSAITQVEELRATALVDLTRREREYQNAQIVNFGHKGYTVTSSGEIDIPSVDESGTVIASLPADQRKDAKDRAKKALQRQKATINKIREGINEAFSKLSSFVENLLPNTPERKEILGAISQFTVPNFGDLRLDKVSDSLGGAYGKQRVTDQVRALGLQGSSLELKSKERFAELDKSALAMALTLTQRTKEREAIEDRLYDARRKDLDYQLSAGAISTEQFEQKALELDYEKQLTKEAERRQDVMEIQLELHRQTLDTIRSTVDGTAKALTDSHALTQIFGNSDPRARREARVGYVFGVLKAATDPLRERMNQNLTQNIADSLGQNDKVRKLFEGPETAMKLKMQEAGTFVGTSIAESMRAAGDYVAAAIAAAMTRVPADAPNVGGDGPAGDPLFSLKKHTPPGKTLSISITDPNAKSIPIPTLPALASAAKVSIPTLTQTNGTPQLAFRNNNPGNLEFRGQKDATLAPDGRFAKFPTPEAGYNALLRQMRMDQNRDLSVRDFVTKYAPPSENDTELYIKQLTEQLHTTEDTNIKKLNRDALAQFVAKKESSTVVATGARPFANLFDPTKPGLKAADDDGQRAMDAYLATPFAQGVRQVLGDGKGYGLLKNQSAKAWALYDRPSDEIRFDPTLFSRHVDPRAKLTVYPDRERSDTDLVFSHEMAHRWEESNQDFFKQWATKHPNDKNLDPYSRTDSHEAFAQATASGIEFLRRSQNATPAELSAMMADELATREAEVSGTSDVIAELLKNPYYASHPAQGRLGQRYFMKAEDPTIGALSQGLTPPFDNVFTRRPSIDEQLGHRTIGPASPIRTPRVTGGAYGRLLGVYESIYNSLPKVEPGKMYEPAAVAATIPWLVGGGEKTAAEKLIAGEAKGARGILQSVPPNIIRNEHGMPLRVYHGTIESFSEIDPTKSQGGGWGPGAYFSKYRSIANDFSRWDWGKLTPYDGLRPNVHMAHLAFDNPFKLAGPLPKEIEDVLMGKYNILAADRGAEGLRLERRTGLVRSQIERGDGTGYHAFQMTSHMDDYLNNPPFSASGLNSTELGPLLRRLGYDGIDARNIWGVTDHPNHMGEFVAFDKKSILSPYLSLDEPVFPAARKSRGPSTALLDSAIVGGMQLWKRSPQGIATDLKQILPPYSPTQGMQDQFRYFLRPDSEGAPPRINPKFADMFKPDLQLFDYSKTPYSLLASGEGFGGNFAPPDIPPALPPMPDDMFDPSLAGYEARLRAEDLARKPSLGNPTAGLPPIPGEEVPVGKVPPKPITKMEAFRNAAASYAGEIGGTVIGSNIARLRHADPTYASFGAQAGTVLGTMVGGPLGGIAGGIIGGIAGGLLGDRKKDEVVINHLESIEFNTREQISAIQQGTDKLLKRDSGIFNLPTDFNIPSYTPQFGGGGVSIGGDTYQVTLGNISIGNGMSKTEVHQVVENAVASAIDGARRTSGRTNSRLS